MNDILLLAGYCFNNCELDKTLSLLGRHPLDAEAAVLRIKCLYELDKSSEGAAFATKVQKDFPFHGPLHYHRGISLYLAGSQIGEIEEAFFEALELGCQEANMGLSFLAFVARDFDKSIGLLRSVSFEDGESEHSRMLKLFQVYLGKEDLENAESCLYQSRVALSEQPSLLRSLWSELCLVRLLRATGQFETARINVERLLSQLSPARVPRLHRNALEAKQHIYARDSGCHIAVPSGAPRLDSAVLSSISKKPVLHSLYEYLKSKGRTGATKEDIINDVWNESYNPLIHDDRLYKAVGRLRRLLGDDNESPQSLLQIGRSYVLNAQYVSSQS